MTIEENNVANEAVAEGDNLEVEEIVVGDAPIDKADVVGALRTLADNLEGGDVDGLTLARYNELVTAMTDGQTIVHSDFMSGFVTSLGFTFRCIVTDADDSNFRVRVANIESDTTPSDDHMLGEILVKRPEIESDKGTHAERSAMMTATSMSVSQALYGGVKPITPCPMPPQHLSAALAKIDEKVKRKLKKNKGLREAYSIIEAYMHPWLMPGEMALINQNTGEAVEATT